MHDGGTMLHKQGEIKMKKLLSISILASLMLVIAGSEIAGAATASTNLQVTATVVAYCNVSTSAVNFGNVDGQAAKDSMGSISVDCTYLQPYHVALDDGLHFSSERRISDGGTYHRPYTLSNVAFGGVAWGDTGYGNTYSAAAVAGTGTGSTQTLDVYGQLPTFTGVPSSTTMTDTVTVTVTY